MASDHITDAMVEAARDVVDVSHWGDVSYYTSPRAVAALEEALSAFPAQKSPAP